MTKDQLLKVKDFKIENEHGSIEWPGLTDLSSVNLEESVSITSK